MGSTADWAIVLGASSGVGAAISKAVAQISGLNVFGMHRGNWPAQADEGAASIAAAGRRCVMRVGDAGTAESAVRGAEAFREVAGPQSVALFVHSIACASLGSFVGGGEWQFRPQQVARTFDAMAHSFVYWVQAMLAEDLLPRGARVLGLTNPIPQNLTRGFGLICASKAALEIYVRCLAMEFGRRGICVNLLNFGLVETPAVKAAFGPGEWAVAKAGVERVVPARRLQSLEEVAGFVALLLRPEADWMTGATIDFTGGQGQSLLDPIFNPND